MHVPVDATVSTRSLSARMRPSASKMRPRSGSSGTVLVLRASTVCCSDSACTVCRNHSRTPIGAEQERGDEGEDAEARGALVSSHGDQSGRSAPRRGAGARVSAHASFGEPSTPARLMRMHQRPTGTSSGLSTMAPDRDDRDDDTVGAARTTCSSPMNAADDRHRRLADGRAERRRTAPPATTGGRSVIDVHVAGDVAGRGPSRSTTSRAACRRARSYIRPSTNPARAPFCGPPAAPAAAARASIDLQRRRRPGAGRRTACAAARAATSPTENSRSSGPWTSEASISRRRLGVDRRLDLGLRLVEDDASRSAAGRGRRAARPRAAAPRPTDRLITLRDDADGMSGGARLVVAAGGEHDVAVDDAPEHRACRRAGRPAAAGRRRGRGAGRCRGCSVDVDASSSSSSTSVVVRRRRSRRRRRRRSTSSGGVVAAACRRRAVGDVVDGRSAAAPSSWSSSSAALPATTFTADGVAGVGDQHHVGPVGQHRRRDLADEPGRRRRPPCRPRCRRCEPLLISMTWSRLLGLTPTTSP